MHDIELKAHFIHGLSNKVRLKQSQISQSSISQHLSCLKGCGLVNSRQEGKYVYYQIKNNQILELLKLIDSVVENTGDDIQSCQYHTI